MLQIVGMSPTIQQRAYMANAQGFPQLGAVQTMRLLQLIDRSHRDGIQVELGHLADFLLQTHRSNQLAYWLIKRRDQRVTLHGLRLHRALGPCDTAHCQDPHKTHKPGTGPQYMGY